MKIFQIDFHRITETVFSIHIVLAECSKVKDIALYSV